MKFSLKINAEEMCRQIMGAFRKAAKNLVEHRNPKLVYPYHIGLERLCYKINNGVKREISKMKNVMLFPIKYFRSALISVK